MTYIGHIIVRSSASCYEDIFTLFQFCRLLIHMMSPSMELCQRLFVLDLLCNDPKCKDVLKLTVHINSTVRTKTLY